MSGVPGWLSGCLAPGGTLALGLTLHVHRGGSEGVNGRCSLSCVWQYRLTDTLSGLPWRSVAWRGVQTRRARSVPRRKKRLRRGQRLEVLESVGIKRLVQEITVIGAERRPEVRQCLRVIKAFILQEKELEETLVTV